MTEQENTKQINYLCGNESDHMLEIDEVYPLKNNNIIGDDNTTVITESEDGDKHNNNHESDYVVKREGKLVNRMLVCFLAICLLWLTSLQFCVILVSSFIKLPLFSSVSNHCSYAYSVIDQQRSAYISCIDSQLQKCSKTFRRDILKANSNLVKVQVVNNQYLQKFQSLSNNGSVNLLNAKQAMKSWSDTGVLYVIPYQLNSTASQQNKANIMIGGSSSSSKTSIYSSSLLYSSSSDSSVSHLSDYTDSVFAYNANYVKNKTNSINIAVENIIAKVSLPHLMTINLTIQPLYAMVDEVFACVSLGDDTTSSCSIGPGLKKLYDTAQLTMNNRLIAIERSIGSIQSTFYSFAGSVSNAISAANSFYDSVTGPLGILSWIVDNTNGLFPFVSQLCGKSSPNWCSFTKQNWFVNTPSLPTVPKIEFQADASVLWNKVKGIETSFLRNISNVDLTLKKHLTKWMKDLQHSIATSTIFLPNDYHPPSYPYGGSNHTTEKLKQKSKTNSFLSGIQQLLKGTNFTSKTSTINVQQTLNTTSNESQSLLSSFRNYWSSFSSFSFNSFWDSILSSILTIQGILFLFDYIYRGLKTFKLIRQFWGKGVAKLPQVDIRSEKSDFNWSMLTYIQHGLELVPFFWLQVLISLYFLILVTIGIYAIFVLQYYSYKDFCVQHVVNSTIISENLKSIGVNYASLDGNTDLTSGISDYNIQWSQQCSSLYVNSKQQYDSTISSLLTTNSSLKSTLDEWKFLNKVIDVKSFDKLFYSACCGQNSLLYKSQKCQKNDLQCPKQSTSLSNDPYNPPGYYLNDPSFNYNNLIYPQQSIYKKNNGKNISYTSLSSAAMGKLQYGLFDCSSLPSCKVSCAGPDQIVVEKATSDCYCMAGWYFNGYMIEMTISVIIYILLNVSRILFFKGLVMIFWKSLTPKLFEFKGNCDYFGEFDKLAEDNNETPDDNIESQQPKKSFSCCCIKPKETLSDQIKKMMRSYERKGYMYMLFSLCLNIPWIYLLYTTPNSIKYSQK